jgi:hypothetical protein
MANLKREKQRRLIHLGLIHDAIINTLEDRLLDSLMDYNIIKKEQIYYDTNTLCNGECDLYAVSSYGKNKYLLCFEVKTYDDSDNREKALKQLSKDINYYSKIFKPTRIFAFYAYGLGHRYFIERITRDKFKKLIRD